MSSHGPASSGHRFMPTERCVCGAAWPCEGAFKRDVPEILTNEVDEQLMRETVARCYSQDHKGFRVSVDHYRYLAEQIVSLRQHIKRCFARDAAVKP